MEFVPGGSLRNLLRKFGPLEERVTSNYTRQLLQALQYIHNKNIIHRYTKVLMKREHDTVYCIILNQSSSSCKPRVLSLLETSNVQTWC